MKKLILTSTVALYSLGALAATYDQKQIVSATVKFSQPLALNGKITVASDLIAGVNENNQKIAQVSVTGGNKYWLIGNDPNDSSSVGKAPDKGWLMKSKSDPTKVVTVAVSDENRAGYEGDLGKDNILWNRMLNTEVVDIVVYGQQTITAADDYQLTVNIARYIP